MDAADFQRFQTPGSLQEFEPLGGTQPETGGGNQGVVRGQAQGHPCGTSPFVGHVQQVQGFVDIVQAQHDLVVHRQPKQGRGFHRSGDNQSFGRNTAFQALVEFMEARHVHPTPVRYGLVDGPNGLIGLACQINLEINLVVRSGPAQFADIAAHG